MCTSSNNSSTVVWNMNYSNTGVNSGSTGVSNSANVLSFSYIINRCRECNHAHTQTGGVGCYDVVGNSIAFVLCHCKEHVPTDNLEYLEWLVKKQDNK